MSKHATFHASTQSTGLTEQELEMVLQHFTAKSISKKTTMLKAGSVAKEVYYLVKGCIRLYYEKDGEDISAYFFTEKMFAGAYDSFISRQPSRHAMEALEDCEVMAITYPAFQELLHNFPKMNEWVRKILEDRFVDLHALFTSHILDSAEERYLKLLQERPDLVCEEFRNTRSLLFSVLRPYP